MQFEIMSGNLSFIFQALVVFAEGLEDKTSEIRSGACRGLQILEVRKLATLLI
jgi:hypothetical protein